MIKGIFIFLFWVLNSICFASNNNATNVLVFIGGHEFDEEYFFNNILDKADDINYKVVKHPNALMMLNPDSMANYDTLLLFDMPQDLSNEDKVNFKKLTDKGKGIVVLHHATGSYPNWNMFNEFAGGQFHFGDWKKADKVMKGSDYRLDHNIKAYITDTKHPITKGVDHSFTIKDEIYINMQINEGIRPLVKTNDTLSCPQLVWTNKYSKSRIVTILFGHNKTAWDNPNFKKILFQALKWSGKKK